MSTPPSRVKEAVVVDAKQFLDKFGGKMQDRYHLDQKGFVIGVLLIKPYEPKSPWSLDSPLTLRTINSWDVFPHLRLPAVFGFHR